MSEANRSLILIVDDNPNNLQLLGSMLRENEFSVAVAQNGVQALEYVKKKKPDLILLDIMMPEIDGYEVCLKLKEDIQTERIPVIFLTAKSDPENIIRGFDVGGVDYITKPFIKKVVLARINVHIKLNKTLEKLEEASVTDEMTGVFNRRFAYKVMERQIMLARREKSSFVICYMDLDNLKLVNDTYGHDEGDRFITIFVNSLNSLIRGSDYVFRMGGDEFMLYIANTRIPEADKLMLRIKEVLLTASIQELPIDFSYGLAEFDSEGNQTIHDLIATADARMYESKKAKKRERGLN
ncbi:MAG: diguanylate cyclase [Spirochaetales bacterium]|nr:diguanylate cyclase [Spirochaetales bacterium]